MLKQRAISAVVWSTAEIFLRQGLQFFVSILLARLVSPEEFGTIALLYLFTGIAGTFVDGGFSYALIQSQDVTHEDESTVFWINLGMGTLVSLLLALAGPAIARMFDIPVLSRLTLVFALNIFLTALGSIHNTLLTKRLNFRAQLKVTGWATFLSAIVAISMASQGLGVWALAAQTLASTVVTTALLWTWTSWRPLTCVSRSSARRLFSFGGHLMASALLDVAYTRVYTLLIGRFYGVRELGFYGRADSTKQLPVGVLTGILGRVAFPIFAAASEDPIKLRRGVRMALRGMMLLNVPMMLGLVALAEPLVMALFGPTWLPSVPLLRVLALGGVFWPLHVINLNVLMAQGHSKTFFRLEVVKKVLGVALVVAGSLLGVTGIAWSQVTFGALAFVLNAHAAQRTLGYGVLAQTRDFLPVVGAAIPMAMAVYYVELCLDLAPQLEVLVLGCGGATLFMLLAVSFRIEALAELLALRRQLRPQP